MEYYEVAKRGFNQDVETAFDKIVIKEARRIVMLGRNKSPLIYSDFKYSASSYMSKAAIMTAVGELVREGKLIEIEWSAKILGAKRQSKPQMAWNKSKDKVNEHL